jgi:hypothetical protein
MGATFEIVAQSGGISLDQLATGVFLLTPPGGSVSLGGCTVTATPISLVGLDIRASTQWSSDPRTTTATVVVRIFEGFNNDPTDDNFNMAVLC